MSGISYLLDLVDLPRGGVINQILTLITLVPNADTDTSDPKWASK